MLATSLHLIAVVLSPSTPVAANWGNKARPHTVSHRTEVGAFGILGTPASATAAAHVTETIQGYATCFFPLAPIAPPPLPQGGGTDSRLQSFL